MLVTIVYVPTPDMRGPDLTRMEKVEDIPDEVARRMLADGSAREPSEAELAAHNGGAQLKNDGASPASATKADIATAIEKHGRPDTAADQA